jgi:deoxyribonuclease V
MQYHELHPWSVSITEAQRIQQRLRRHIEVGTAVRNIRYIAGADIAVARATPTVYAGVVVLDYPTLAIVERKSLVSTTTFPYIPGLLSFREAPALLQVFAQLETTPDVVVFDGQGIAHPRGLGIASHMGLLLDIPAIGCAKSRLTGRYEDPLPRRGAHTPLYGGHGQVLGAVLRTKDRTKPVFVSVGHKIALSQALDILLHCHRGYRIPEPTRLADQYVGSLRQAHGEQAGAKI